MHTSGDTMPYTIEKKDFFELLQKAFGVIPLDGFVEAFPGGCQIDDLLDSVEALIIDHPGRRQIVPDFILSLADQGVFHDPVSDDESEKSPDEDDSQETE